MRYINSVVILSSFLFFQCERTFNINENYIKSSRPFEHTIGICEISVKSFNDNGIPDEFDTIKVIRLLRVDKEVSPSKKVYFSRNNPGYLWFYRKDSSVQNLHEEFPINFEVGRWYYCWGLRRYGSPDYRIFFEVQTDKSLKTYHSYRPAPW